MITPDRLASWRRKATPELLAACNEIEELQRLAENNGRAAVAHRAGEDILQQNIDALVAEKDVLLAKFVEAEAARDLARDAAVALEQENARLREQTSGWHTAYDIVERALRKDYDISGQVLADLAAAFGLEDRC
jgi:hypothetical protein